MDKQILCDTCNTPLLDDELPENREPALLPLVWGEKNKVKVVIPLPKKHECFVCFCKRADWDGMVDDPEHQKLHEEFVEKQSDKRRKKFN